MLTAADLNQLVTSPTRGLTRQEYVRLLQRHHYELEQIKIEREKQRLGTYSDIDPALKEVQERLGKQLDLLEQELDEVDAKWEQERSLGEPRAGVPA